MPRLISLYRHIYHGRRAAGHVQSKRMPTFYVALMMMTMLVVAVRVPQTAAVLSPIFYCARAPHCIGHDMRCSIAHIFACHFPRVVSAGFSRRAAHTPFRLILFDGDVDTARQLYQQLRPHWSRQSRLLHFEATRRIPACTAPALPRFWLRPHTTTIRHEDIEHDTADIILTAIFPQYAQTPVFTKTPDLYSCRSILIADDTFECTITCQYRLESFCCNADDMPATRNTRWRDFRLYAARRRKGHHCARHMACLSSVFHGLPVIPCWLDSHDFTQRHKQGHFSLSWLSPGRAGGIQTLFHTVAISQ